MSFLDNGALIFIFVKQCEVILKIAEFARSGSKSIKNIERGFLDDIHCLYFLLENPGMKVHFL